MRRRQEPVSSGSPPGPRPGDGGARPRALRLARIDDATDPAALAAVTGPIAAVERTPLRTVGYTGARHERLVLTLRAGGRRRALVVKHVRRSADWTARRSEDPCGREAALLAEPALDAVWEAFACPYLAFAADGDDAALVMDDLSPHLFPDVREPLPEEAEERLLGALAALHARFWASPALAVPWLARPAHYAGLLDVRCAADPAALAALPNELADAVARGWAAARRLLPPRAARLMELPAAEAAAAWDGLPRTLVHGDAKVANFALRPDGRVAAFDWALVGAAPAAVDVGWFLAVNATRLARSKDAVLARHRALVDARLAAPPADAVWDALAAAAVVAGARLLLWSKALAVEGGRAGGAAEWAWWVERLEAAGA